MTPVSGWVSGRYQISDATLTLRCQCAVVSEGTSYSTVVEI